MKIEITHYEEKHSTEFTEDCDIYDMMDHIYDLVVMTGFAKESINQWIEGRVEGIEHE